jgi:hypothetical protein
VPENDAEYYDKWDLWEIGVDGSNEKLVVENACWGTFLPSGKEIVFARGEKVFQKNVETGEEKCIFDGNESMKKGTIVQQPELSPDGKYLAATLRGSSRETGIWNLEKKEWNTTGGGCQMDWFPSGTEIYRVNSTGNGGTAAPSEIFAMKIADGKPVEKVTKIKEFKMMDLPGRRSHEYFPKFDQKGIWMVWAATDKGHDHDLYDYELYLFPRMAKSSTPQSRIRYLFCPLKDSRSPSTELSNHRCLLLLKSPRTAARSQFPGNSVISMTPLILDAARNISGCFKIRVNAPCPPMLEPASALPL